MFDNPVLEYFSHIHPAVPVVVYLPVITIFLYIGFTTVSVLPAIGMYFAGVLLWTFTEYILHRFVFHYEPKSAIGKKIHFLTHGVHHAYPQDSTRMVMPLLLSVPLAVAFYFLFQLIFGDYFATFYSGFVTGYVLYDSIHYATHHWKMTGFVGRFLKQYHMKHHYMMDDRGFGVSSPLWDYVFNTRIKKGAQAKH